MGAHWFSTESQDEFTERIVREGQSYVEEEYVLVAALVGVLDGFPQRQFVGVYKGKRFPQKGHVPQVGVLLTVCHRRAAYDVVAVACQVESSVSLLSYACKEFLVGDIAFRLQPVVHLQQVHEGLEVGLVLHLVGDHPSGVRLVDMPLQPWA